MIGRTASYCFEDLGRPDTPKEFVAGWQKQNSKHYSAAITYMNRRLAEAESLTGVEGKNNIANALLAAVRKNGDKAVNGFFENKDKHDECKKVIGLMESGAFNIDSRIPMYGELEALVNYIDGH
ncbi:hypothetical protein [Solimicrobium silvestre]|nr:hypothetical protein [Solimicrobium silvestre]